MARFSFSKTLVHHIVTYIFNRAIAENLTCDIIIYMPNIKIYSTPTCPWCKKAKAYLGEKGIAYESVDVSSNETAQKEMIEKSGQMGVPVIDIDGKIIIGFDQEEIDKALKL